MNSERTDRADQIIATIIDELDDRRITRMIDEPVDTALRAYLVQLDSRDSALCASEILSDFVRCAYKESLKAEWVVSDARATTMSLLEIHYEGVASHGYFAALLDCSRSEIGGVRFVLAQVAEIIKAVERRKYVSGVLTTRLDPCDWPLACEIIKALLGRYAPLLPPAVHRCPAEQLVDEIATLILAMTGTLTTLQRVTHSPPQTPAN